MNDPECQEKHWMSKWNADMSSIQAETMSAFP